MCWNFSIFFKYSWIKSSFKPLTDDLTCRTSRDKLFMHIKSFVLKFYTFWDRSPHWATLSAIATKWSKFQKRLILTKFLRRFDSNLGNHIFWCAQNVLHFIPSHMVAFDLITPTYINATYAMIFRNTNINFENPREFDQNFQKNKIALVDSFKKQFWFIKYLKGK